MFSASCERACRGVRVCVRCARGGALEHQTGQCTLLQRSVFVAAGKPQRATPERTRRRCADASRLRGIVLRWDVRGYPLGLQRWQVRLRARLVLLPHRQTTVASVHQYISAARALPL